MLYSGSIVLALCFCAVLGGVPLDNRFEGRIVNGNDAENGQFPYMVSLRNKYTKHFCGGAILNEFTILTSANCISDSKAEEIRVNVGSVEIIKGKFYEINEIISHPDFDMDTLETDIALLRTTKKISFNENVQPIKIIDRKIGDGNLIFAGWGRDSTNGNVPKILKYLPAQLLSRKECENRITLNKDTMCTVSGASKGTCFGDNGGPLVLKGEGVVAIHSFTIGGCGSGYPDGYCSVFEYKDWIEGNLFKA